MATKVKLRKKAISGNRESLYLDFYPPILNTATGLQTRREFLGMYVVAKAKSPVDRQANKDAIQIAEQIRQRRELELNKPEVYSDYEQERLKRKVGLERDFVQYFRGLAHKRKSSNYDNWTSALHYLEAFTGGSLKIGDLNEAVCNGFRDYLLSTKSRKSSKASLSQNSAVSYFNKFKAALKQAYKDKLLPDNLNSRVEAIKTAETHRNFLTLEELNSLVKAECRDQQLKSAALFSALTGLRFSDIQKLTWGEIEPIGKREYILRFTQKKTKGAETLPVSEQAVKLLGKKKDSSEKVFEGLTYSAFNNTHLVKWVESAGIKKNITFHCFRHTYATLQLSSGTDIYTVSKLLGHKDIKTTQIYAKVIDLAKRAAANKITLDLGNL